MGKFPEIRRFGHISMAFGAKFNRWLLFLWISKWKSAANFHSDEFLSESQRPAFTSMSFWMKVSRQLLFLWVFKWKSAVNFHSDGFLSESQPSAFTSMSFWMRVSRQLLLLWIFEWKSAVNFHSDGIWNKTPCPSSVCWLIGWLWSHPISLIKGQLVSLSLNLLFFHHQFFSQHFAVVVGTDNVHALFPARSV